MDQLMQKLMISKAIMDKTDGIKRIDNREMNSPSNMVESFNMPQAKYNIPQEYLQEQPSQQMSQPYLSSLPVENTKPVGVPTIDAIKNSRLPDEIKKLMMEHPISQPQQASPTLSNDLVERASRLMKENPGSYMPESAKSKPQTQSTEPSPSTNIDYKLLKGDTGYDAAQWLIDYCENKEVKLPEIRVHSSNLEGKRNIEGLFL
jgi:hypothetical protein